MIVKCGDGGDYSPSCKKCPFAYGMDSRHIAIRYNNRAYFSDNEDVFQRLSGCRFAIYVSLDQPEVAEPRITRRDLDEIAYRFRYRT